MKKIAIVAAVLFVALLCQNVNGQDCRECKVRSIVWAKTSQLKEMPPKIFDGGVSLLKDKPRRLESFNWGCVAAAVGAYVNCSTAKRGERLRLLQRILKR